MRNNLTGKEKNLQKTLHLRKLVPKFEIHELSMLLYRNSFLKRTKALRAPAPDGLSDESKLTSGGKTPVKKFDLRSIPVILSLLHAIPCQLPPQGSSFVTSQFELKSQFGTVMPSKRGSSVVMSFGTPLVALKIQYRAKYCTSFASERLSAPICSSVLLNASDW